MRKIVCFMLIGVLMLFTGCSTLPVEDSSGGVRIVTTIFPPYDFAREITGGEAEIHMLLKPGTESHSYEPSPADILLVESSDLFIYNGGESDTWVEDLLENIDTSNLRILRMMDCVEGLEEETVEGMQIVHSHHHEEEHHHLKAEEYDEHVWTSPENAIRIADAICDKLIEIDSKNKEFYLKNTAEYKGKLEALSGKFRQIVNEGNRQTMIFGDRFPFRYFAEEYGLMYRAAFPGCSAESEPGAKTVAYLMDKVRQEEIPHIFYIEFSNQKIAKSIQEETGAEPLLFHSCHNLSADEMERGVTYLMLMEQNAENLKEALQ